MMHFVNFKNFRYHFRKLQYENCLEIEGTDSILEPKESKIISCILKNTRQLKNVNELIIICKYFALLHNTSQLNSYEMSINISFNIISEELSVSNFDKKI